MMRSRWLSTVLHVAAAPLAYPLGFTYGLWQRRVSLCRCALDVSVLQFLLALGLCAGLVVGVVGLVVTLWTAAHMPSADSTLPAVTTSAVLQPVTVHCRHGEAEFTTTGVLTGTLTPTALCYAGTATMMPFGLSGAATTATHMVIGGTGTSTSAVPFTPAP